MFRFHQNKGRIEALNWKKIIDIDKNYKQNVGYLQKQMYWLSTFSSSCESGSSVCTKREDVHCKFPALKNLIVHGHVKSFE